MNPQTLQDAYGRIARRYQLPELEVARCTIESRELNSPDATWAELQRMAPSEGWLLFQSEVICFQGGNLPDASPEWGSLLAAETVDNAGRSIHLRQCGAGWLLTVCEPGPPEKKAGHPDLILADDLTQMGTKRAPGPLCYRRYWRLDIELGLIPAFAAFTGFGCKEN